MSTFAPVGASRYAPPMAEPATPLRRSASGAIVEVDALYEGALGLQAD